MINSSTCVFLFLYPQLFQRDEPLIHRMHGILVSQLSRLLSRFVKPNVIRQAKNITQIDLANEAHHKSNDEVQIGFECKQFLKENEASLDLKTFFQGVKNFYIAAASYMIHNYPFNEELLVNAEVLDISQRSTAKFTTVEYFTSRFSLIPDDKMDQLQDEFNLYQIDETIDDCTKDVTRIDQKWHVIGQMMELSRYQRKYSLLSQVMKCVLVVFHSNSDAERVFSMVDKIKTKHRGNMSTRTMSSLLTHKLSMQNRNLKCYTTTYSDDVLQAAKKSTYLALHAGASTSK